MRGYTAYVLTYRLPGEGRQAGRPAPLQDAQRALRLIRQQEAKVSLLGFSAGGHCRNGCLSRRFLPLTRRSTGVDDTAPRADGAALIYPVISRTSVHPYRHPSAPRRASRRGGGGSRLVGTNLVSGRTPPCFLVQAEDDNVSDPHNTLIMAAACRQHQVPVTLYRYASGGHGFALGRAGTPSVEGPSATQRARRVSIA